MKKINPSVSLPYWDYTIDTEIVQPFEAVLWTPCFFGKKTGTVRSGSFKLMYGAHGSVLSRKLADKAYSTRLINKRDIQNLKGFCSFKVCDYLIIFTIPYGPLIFYHSKIGNKNHLYSIFNCSSPIYVFAKTIIRFYT
jgi:hypothetical protein